MKLPEYHRRLLRAMEGEYTVVLAPAPEEPSLQDRTAAARAIVDLSSKRFADEWTAAKDLDSKAAPSVALAGPVIVFAGGALVNPPACIAPTLAMPYAVGLSIGLGFLVAGQATLIASLFVRKFVQINLTRYCHPDKTRGQSFPEVLGVLEQIVVDYTAYTATNGRANARKATLLAIGFVLLVLGFGLIAATVVGTSGSRRI